MTQITPPAPSPNPIQPKRPGFAFLIAHPAHWIALGFGSGLSPKAPGTVGTLMAWILWLPIGLAWQHLTHLHLAIPSIWLGSLMLLIGFAIGVWACKQCAIHMNVADPGCIVWDEVIAFWGVLAALQTVGMTDLLTQGIAFMLFRLFDAVKHGPVAWADQAFKGFGWQGGFGIMFDDVIAALLTLIAIFTLFLGLNVLP